MKIWPFDLAAEANDGLDISAEELKTALKPFEKIRAAVGDRMEIMVEFHSLWQLLPAIKIAKALAPFDTKWHEDPIRMDSLADLKRYADASPAPISASETLATRWGFRDLIETGAAGIVMLDLSWCGGISEARKIAAMAEAWHLPVAPHDCTGPVVLAASTHLSLNATNALIQESVRAYYRTWYRDLVTALPEVTNGFITTPPGPGLGMELQPDLEKRFTATKRVSQERLSARRRDVDLRNGPAHDPNHHPRDGQDHAAHNAGDEEAPQDVPARAAELEAQRSFDVSADPGEEEFSAPTPSR